MMRTLISGGPILTMDAPMMAEAVLVEDGVILAVGRESTLRAAAGAYEHVDLQGDLLLPAFIDAHGHFSQMALTHLRPSLKGVQGIDEIRAILRAWTETARLRPGEWIIARDYEPAPGAGYPPQEALDSLAPEHPLLIQHVSGHMGIFNSRALEELRLAKRSTGYFEEREFFDILKRLPLPDEAQLERGYRLAQEEYKRRGFSTVQDGMATREIFPLYDLLLEKNLLELDLIAYFAPEDYDAAAARYGGRSPRLSVGGVKIFLDGSPQARTAWLRRPYAGEASYAGQGILEDAQVVAAMEFAAQRNTQILCHCNGDAAAEQFIRCLTHAEARFPQLKHLRPVLIHGQILGRDQLPRLRPLGAMVSFFVNHIYHWGDMHIKNLGPERAAGISPAGSALRAGVPFTLHQDAPVLPPDVLESLCCAVKRRTKSGIWLGPNEAIPPIEALRAVTYTAAYQCFQESTKGSLTPNKRAGPAATCCRVRTAEPLAP